MIGREEANLILKGINVAILPSFGSLDVVLNRRQFAALVFNSEYSKLRNQQT